MGSDHGNSRYFLRSSGQSSPTLGLAESFWALQNRDLSITESIEQAVENGFSYFEVGLRPERIEQARRLLLQFDLRLIAQGWATTASEAVFFFQQAADLNAAALNLQLGHAYMSSSEATDLFGQIQDQSDIFGIPLLIETHRGRITQDLYRTAQWVRQCPGVTIALDLSHYIVAGENVGGDEQLFHQHLASLLERTAIIHGRISNGQSIQVAADASHGADVHLFHTVWQRAMQCWLADAPADAVFIFEPELGPPPYAPITPAGIESCSRTEQSRVLLNMARTAWTAALTERAAQSVPFQ